MDLHDNNQTAEPRRETGEGFAGTAAPVPGMPAGQPAGAPEPPWVTYKKNGARTASPAYPDRQSYPSAPYTAARRTLPAKTHRGRNIFLMILAFVAALCLGGALMFYVIWSGALTSLEALIHGELPGFSVGMLPAPPEEDLPQERDDEAPSSPETQPEDKGSEPAESVPFQPIENPPKLEIVPVAEEGEDARQELSVPDIAELAKPSVVGVIKYPTENPLDGYTIGSGIIFSEDGYMLTNAHVVADPYSIVVFLNDGTEYDAELVVSDSDADIAILKIDAEGLTPAEFGDSSQLRVGDISVAIGCPASVDLQGTTTFGIISALDRVMTVDARGKTMRLLQTDAAINPGNSGGPLLNRFGQVIGVNTVKMNSATYEGLCFAIPSNELEHIVSDLFTYGYVRGYPAIGISAKTVLAEEDAYGGAPTGVYVATVNPASGAYGKVQVGDIITHCNGTEVITVAQINTIKNRLQVGDSITLTIYRRGKTLDVEIVLVDQYDLTDE